MMTYQETHTTNSWEDYKSAIAACNPSKAALCFSEASPMVVCVPTGGGSDGSVLSLNAFLKTLTSQQQDMHLDREILTQVTTTSTLVEESIVTLVHESSLSWLLPEVKPTRKRITFPLVSIVEFDAVGKIRSLRLHWDQATVLRQISVLPNSLYCKSNSSETTLPVLGPKVVDRVRASLGSVETIDASRRESVASESVPMSARPRPGQTNDMSNILSGNAQADAVRPSSRVLQRPGGQVNDIFSTEPAPVRTSIPIDPRRFVQQVNLFEETPLPSQKPSAPASVVGSDDGTVAAGTASDGGAAGAHGRGRRFYPGRDASTLSFGDSGEDVRTTTTTPPLASPAPFYTSTNASSAPAQYSNSITGGGRASVPGRHNVSNITFGGPEPVVGTAAFAGSVRKEDGGVAAGLSSVAANGHPGGERPGSSAGMRDRNEQSVSSDQRPSSR
ncbi:hypothetical protein HDU67_005542 [Dinochytrium kinnereticum]|nr:hypothetical protein HDU67_005542 [Dinochytrium kinnereticum]